MRPLIRPSAQLQTPQRVNIASPISRTGGYAAQWINRQGDVRDDTGRQMPETQIAYFEPLTGHNVPQVFWDFLNSTATVQVGVDTADKLLLDPWVNAMGLPISDAYWANVTIEGKNQDVLIQAFERRVLTYVPGLPQGWQVQMGNIGQHYFEWRYGTSGVTPQKATKPDPAAPAYLVIPRLGVQTKIGLVGVDKNSNMDIPSDPYNAAWYKYGPVPGKVGNSVIDGHLDWYGIPQAIFYYLDRLQVGDRIYVRDVNGIDRVFAVSRQLCVPVQQVSAGGDLRRDRCHSSQSDYVCRRLQHRSAELQQTPGSVRRCSWRVVDRKWGQRRRKN